MISKTPLLTKESRIQAGFSLDPARFGRNSRRFDLRVSLIKLEHEGISAVHHGERQNRDAGIAVGSGNGGEQSIGRF